MVARQQEAAVERPLATAALCRRCKQGSDAGRSRQIRRDRKLQLGTGQSVGDVGAPRRERDAARLSLLSREQTADRGDR